MWNNVTRRKNKKIRSGDCVTGNIFPLIFWEVCNFNNIPISTEAVSWRCSAKKVFLEILKSHMKTPVPESLFNKAVGVKPAILLKRDSDTAFLWVLQNF